ncbi:unnamed protein product [Dibothriocephalus latus]|uniref:RRM domain-containing protein n=1 Tax=Dibothriocephalus latus TaxID=60516 RepID=A0A3P7N6G0_DIBLA|nr:unnamed protein product [Dibothriocephalus latus]
MFYLLLFIIYSDLQPREKETKNASIGTKANKSDRGEIDDDDDPLSIFVGHLKSKVTDSDLRAYFNKFGPVTEAEVIIDRVRRVSRGFGFVTFADRDAVDVVLASCHFLNERRLNVRPADRHGMQLYVKSTPSQNSPDISDPIIVRIYYFFLDLLGLGSATYGSQARWCSFAACIWLSQIKLE